MGDMIKPYLVSGFLSHHYFMTLWSNSHCNPLPATSVALARLFCYPSTACWLSLTKAWYCENFFSEASSRWVFLEKCQFQQRGMRRGFRQMWLGILSCHSRSASICLSSAEIPVDDLLLGDVCFTALRKVMDVGTSCMGAALTAPEALE